MANDVRSRIPLSWLGVGIVVVALGFVAPRFAPTATAVPAESVPAAGEGPGLAAAVGRLAICLVVVCAAVVGVTRLVQTPPAAAAGGMEILAAYPLDGRCAVHLVRAGSRRLVVGIDPSGVKSILELPARFPADEPEESPNAERIVSAFARLAAT